ncbi:hypothetical protein MM221_14565 [Salipaludibacillus sp. LMS25]|uniref:hypothetical protein n=1 Tax=Salipaludibacillus sp. LMS25 TaxID=2924031 RepID=UPI0020D12FAD|nr:hypothetical protein [Salipaludibacillus sp. LMS25]UTR13825.1 hypothetical protein MM221_14565 [Salipaludibacillus sp. LMS25]
MTAEIKKWEKTYDIEWSNVAESPIYLMLQFFGKMLFPFAFSLFLTHLSSVNKERL